MQTGLIVGEEVRAAFQQLRMKRKHRFVIYKLTDDLTGIEVETASERTATFEDFQTAMPKDSAR